MDDNIKLNCACLKTFKLCVLESVINLPEVSLPGAWCGWSQIVKDTVAPWQDLGRRKSVKIQEIFICLFLPYLFQAIWLGCCALFLMNMIQVTTSYVCLHDCNVKNF